MEYSEIVNWLEHARPGKDRADLAKFRELMAKLGDPQEKLRFIHVTGSNGKGSVCTMLAEILKRAGYRTGLYTSPHMSVYNERCRVNGENIPDADFARLAETVWDEAQQMDCSWGLFYKMTAVALLYFAEQHCDVVVLEVGRGGRRDCTNLVTRTELAVINNIGLEHTEYLGDTLGKIAAEKAGIFKPGADAVLYKQSEEVENVVREKAAALGCPLHVTEPEKGRIRCFDQGTQRIDYKDRKDLLLSLPGTYQLKNAEVVLEAVDALKGRGWSIPESAVREGLAGTDWPGRFEVFRTEPAVFGDGAHNSNAVTELAESIRTYFPGRKISFVLTLLWDRNWKEMLDMVAPFAKDFVAVETDDYKALHAAELAAYIRESLRLPAREARSEEEGIRMALESQQRDDVVGVFGSIYLVGAVRDILKAEEEESKA